MKWIYRILGVTVIVMLILELFNQAWYNVFLCLLTLALFAIPSFIERTAKINVPNVLEIIILFFIFAAEILGEIRDYYTTFQYWDVILHTTNGFLCAAIGLSLINILNDSPKFAISLSPVFVALFAFCFSMTVGVLWEFFEFFMDSFFHTNMQKDTILPNGKIDIGLIDTISDMFVNFIGAIISSMFGYFYVKRNYPKSFMRNFMLTKAIENGEEIEPELLEDTEEI
ncbi:MAG: hypothetical protein LBN43_07355 [Oscillospiraceae bacterium]|jgi:hypothetical protein|nr:hypothetical protein [Oscillospiraceae bacterium]